MKVYLPFSNASWSEDPASLWPTIATLVRANDPGSAEERLRAAAERFAGLRDRVARRLPGPLSRSFIKHLGQFRAGHIAREATLYAIEESFLVARLAVREAAQRLAAAGALPEPGAVLYLTLSELTAALAGGMEAGQIRQTVVRRRRARPGAAAAWRGAASASKAAPGAEGAPAPLK